MRPLLAGFVKYSELKDGSLDICDIAEMVDALEVKAENQRRLDEKNK